jgi:hypothetical protein
MNVRSNFDVLQNKVNRLNSLVQYNDKFKFTNTNIDVTTPRTKRTELDADVELYKDSNFFNNSIREDKVDMQIKRTKMKLSMYLNNSNMMSNRLLDTSNFFSTR